jgi:hypothetical protein
MTVSHPNPIPPTYTSRTYGVTVLTACPWGPLGNTPVLRTTSPTHGSKTSHSLTAKAWAGPNVGYGYIDNITYKDIHIENTDSPVVLDQCYFNINQTTCAQYPSKVNITNVNFINITGTSSGKAGNVVADLTCSPGATCNGIHLEGINITSPSGGTPVIVCENIQGDIGVDCVSSANSTSAKL